MLIAFDAVASTHYGSQHWSETLLSFGLGWIVFTVVAGHMLMSSSARFGTPAHTIRDAIRTYTTWIGICFGIFYIPAAGLSAAGTLLMVFPLYGTFLTGLVLLIVDPPRRWPQPRGEGTVDTTLVKRGSSITTCCHELVLVTVLAHTRFSSWTRRKTWSSSWGALGTFIPQAGWGQVIFTAWPQYEADDKLSR